MSFEVLAISGLIDTEAAKKRTAGICRIDAVAGDNTTTVPTSRAGAAHATAIDTGLIAVGDAIFTATCAVRTHVGVRLFAVRIRVRAVDDECAYSARDTRFRFTTSHARRPALLVAAITINAIRTWAIAGLRAG